jgi:dsRNA-specific ribonuclease
MAKRISPTWRKRLEFIGLSVLGPLGGDIHYERWPEKSAFGKTQLNGPQAKRRRP